MCCKQIFRSDLIIIGRFRWHCITRTPQYQHAQQWDSL